MRNEKYTQKSKQARKPAVTDEFAPLADLLGNLIAKYASVLDPDDGEKAPDTVRTAPLEGRDEL